MESIRTLSEPWLKRLGHIYEQYANLSEREKAQIKADSYNKEPGDRHLLDGYDCPICKNKGQIAVVVEYNGIYSDTNQLCVCHEIRKQRLLMKKSGLLHMVDTCRFDNYQTPEKWHESIKRAAQRFCKDDAHHFFYIGGQSGAGKTHICTAITAHYLNQGKKARYMVWIDESQRIKGLVNDPEYVTIMDEFKKTDVLYIDDLFKPIKNAKGEITPPSYADIRLAMEIINYRYNNPGLITIISCERTIGEMIELDEALAGRISQLSDEGGYCINLNKDIRKNWRLRNVTTL